MHLCFSHIRHTYTQFIKTRYEMQMRSFFARVKFFFFSFSFFLLFFVKAANPLRRVPSPSRGNEFPRETFKLKSDLPLWDISHLFSPQLPKLFSSRKELADGHCCSTSFYSIEIARTHPERTYTYYIYIRTKC